MGAWDAGPFDNDDAADFANDSMLQLKSVLLNATTEGMDPLFEAI